MGRDIEFTSHLSRGAISLCKCYWNNVRSNNALELAGGHRGRAVLAMNCVLGGAERAPCLAAQLGR